MSTEQRKTGDGGKEAPQRSRASSPAPKKAAGGPTAKTAAKPSEAAKSLSAEGFPKSFAFESLPPQLCPLALGTVGLARGLAAYTPILSPLSAFLSLVAAIYLAIYGTKILFAFAAFRRDTSEPATMSALAATPAALQVLALRLYQTSELITLSAAQLVVLVCHITAICCTVRFLLLNFQKRQLPDPSWFPGTLLYGMTNITSFAIGPSWLQATMSAHFWFTMSMYAPLKLTVLYRLFLSKARDSVAPNAGMAVLMAPASFYTMAHLSSG